MGPLATMGLGLGANLLSGWIGGNAQRKREEKIRRMRLAALEPMILRLKQAQLGPSQSEGSVLNALVQQKLTELASRGVLGASNSGAQVAAAIAPVEARRQDRLDDLATRVAAAQQAIYAGEEAPGFGDAFAGTLGETGNILANIAGQQWNKRYNTTGAGDGQQVTTGPTDLRELDPNYEDEYAGMTPGPRMRR